MSFISEVFLVECDVEIKSEETLIHSCSVCEKEFETRPKLLNHLRNVHQNSEAFQCRICSKELKSKNALSRHVKIVHENFKTFQCVNCLKKFASPSGKN